MRWQMSYIEFPIYDSSPFSIFTVKRGKHLCHIDKNSRQQKRLVHLSHQNGSKRLTVGNIQVFLKKILKHEVIDALNN